MQAAAASEAYDAVEAGVDLQSSNRKSATDAAAAAAGAASATQPPPAPAGRLTCYLCKMVFGVPNGARHVLGSD